VRPGEACDVCLRRAWLLGRLAGHLDRARARVGELLALGDGDLVAALAPRNTSRVAAEHRSADVPALRRHCAEVGVETVCRCAPDYPPVLLALPNPPAALFLAGGHERLGELLGKEAVAIVGTRRASPYGLEQARALGRGLGACGVAIVSGLALGIDGAAHAGVVEAGAGALAVLPAGAERAYPPSHRTLLRRLLGCGGAAVSELPPHTPVRRWMFPARNRLIAALAAVTVVVEARADSGALLTARVALECGGTVGAVPGRVGTVQSEGPHELLAGGARIVRGPQDVLDLLFGPGERRLLPDARASLEPELERLLRAVTAGEDTPGALARAGIPPERGLAALAALELEGYLRRGAGGRYSVVP
jgi:DNA processing protein